MILNSLIQKSDTLKTAIESLEEVLKFPDQEFLKPTLTYLKEEKRKVAKEIAKLNQPEEINHLSAI
ncbi:hypothetical protein [Flavobacterium fluviatile]|uniref:hypothetical protein n=1 Tax=Flavobacterium fluviatile TaxID=1862387 RepID=UPI0013D28CF5|nr:hypothetical protein [Flavobacterium fluviatile]